MTPDRDGAAKPTLRVAASPCKRCLFGADPLVSKARKAELISSALADDTFFVCHVPALRDMDDDWTGETNVACHAFYQRYKADSLALRLATMFGWVQFVDVEAEAGDHGEA